jgi:pimeloyl-ACP methyl ester carboxylesterase
MGQKIISSVLFQPPDPPSYSENNEKLSWMKCVTNGKQINVPSIFLKNAKSDQIILYSHGNATDLGQMFPYLEVLCNSLKINVFSYEYQGYGVEKGSKKPSVPPSEKGCCDSIDAAVSYITDILKFPKNKIIVFGTSLGSGPSVFAASKTDTPFRGLILQSPFTSVVRIKVPVTNKLFFDMFPNIDRIESVDSPVFVIHGKEDEVVPVEHGEALAKKCKKKYKPLIIDYAGHNNIMEILSLERYLKRIYEFLQHLNEEEKKETKPEEEKK